MSIWGVITVEIKSHRWTPVDKCKHLERSMKIKQQVLRNVSSSRATWWNLSTPSLFEWIWLKRFMRVVDWRWNAKSNGYAQFCLYIPMLFDDVNHSCVFWVIELFRHLNPWISFFPHPLDSFPYPRSFWKWDFTKIIGRNRLLNAKTCRRNHITKSPWFGSIGSFWAVF